MTSDSSQGKKSTKRLDQILIEEGLVSEEQVREALHSQKEYSGKIGSNLMRHGFIDEAALVKALSIQYECEGVVLSEIEIPEEIVKFVPARVAVARRVMPFDYDVEENVLKVACEDPLDEDLIHELDFVARGKKVQLVVAVELSLKTAIANYYMTSVDGDKEINADENSETLSQSSGLVFAADDKAVTPEVPLNQVLLVTDDEDDRRVISDIMGRENYEVTVTDSANDAIDIIDGRQFHTVFIRDTVSGDYLDLIDRLRKISPRTRVRYYESSANLLLNQKTNEAAIDLIIRNLDLFTSLLSSRQNNEENHSGTVGQYVDRLCRRIGLPDKDRMTIINAAYLHDIAKFYYGKTDSSENPRSFIDLTVKLLDSLNFPPLIAEVLRSMYINLRQKYTKRLPIEVLGGNILTVVDIFCDNIAANEKLSLDKFDAIKKKFEDLTGKLFLAEVAKPFIAMIKEEVFEAQTDDKYNQVMLFGDMPELTSHFEHRLRQEGFRTLSISTIDTFVELFRRSRPEMMVLLSQAEPTEVINLIDELITQGVNFAVVPTFLLTNSAAISDLTGMLEKGIEDIIPVNDNPNLLIVKMKKIQQRLGEKPVSENGSFEENGARGRLEDMNLIDLLQAMGPSRKTVRIAVNSGEQELIIYLDEGAIVYAKCDVLTGAEAVYEGLSWKDGTWSAQPVSPGSIPEPNNDYSNESILMEGCRLLDERTRNDISTQEIPIEE
ncbi:MAG: DUF4388 domain-containing protein [candidate division Zixibacteria bacterium]|nr:DUF4388 domain-containing protein [candidate division Zixibacteria bacterium]